MAASSSLTRDGAEGAARAFGAYLRAQRTAARLSLRELAERAQISNPYLSQIERGLHQPSVTVIRSLAEALDLSAEVLLAEAAGLRRAVGADADRDPSRNAAKVPPVESAIRADARLSSAQKRALVAVYRSMVDAATTGVTGT